MEQFHYFEYLPGEINDFATIASPSQIPFLSHLWVRIKIFTKNSV